MTSAPATSAAVPLLTIDDLHVAFDTDNGVVRPVDGVSLSVAAGQTLGLLGESGCGKSMTALAILRLITAPGRIESGSIYYRGRNLLALSEREIRSVRGGEIAMIFQEPMTALNPVFTVGSQIAEAVRLHQKVSRHEVRPKVIDALRLVEIAEPERRADSYPHELSGGMRQRAMIAMALVCEPSLLIADEPTTALDVTIQAQILDLLRGLRDRLGMAMILITHDLGVIAEQADQVAVMYAGRIVERAPVQSLFAHPRHPYTVALLHVVGRHEPGSDGRLVALPGAVPSLLELPSGCRFRDRCDRAIDACASTDPCLEEHAPGHTAACIRL